MSLEILFFFEMVLVALVIIGTVEGAIYIGLHNRRIRRQTGRLVGTADIAVGIATTDLASLPELDTWYLRTDLPALGLGRGEKSELPVADVA